jgi:hypothetical protein
MHRFPVILLLCVLAWGQAPTSTAPKPVNDAKPAANLNDSDNARKAHATVEQAIQALGGETFLSYANKHERGRYYPMYHGRTDSTGIPYSRYAKYPDKDRFEVLHEKGAVKIDAKNDIVLIHNGDQGYEITFKGTGREDPKETAVYLRRRQHSFDWIFRKWTKDPTVAWFYDGMAVVDGKATEQVTLLNAQNDSVTLYFDQNSHLPIKSTYSFRDPADKQRNTEEEVYDNYRLEQGIMTAHSISRLFNGEMSLQRFIANVTYNGSVPDSLFEVTVTYDAKQPIRKK